MRDGSGAAVAGASVTVTNSGTNTTRSVLTDSDGNYTLVNMDAGKYQIRIQAPGFGIFQTNELELLSRQTLRVDASLSVATQVESVNVTAGTDAVITTELGGIAETKTGRELLDLPVAIGSRGLGSTSAFSTLTTQAGVQTDNNGAISVAGAKPSMLSVTIDGISTMSVRNNAPVAELFPSFGAIGEIRVSEINNAAEFGGVSDITTVTKGGTNSLHGGIFENLQNTSMNARNPFSATKTRTQMNNFGVFVGGPVVLPKLYNGKDRTFFFTSYEGLTLPRQTFINHSVPSLALRNGDLNAFSGTILDPGNGQPLPNKQVPASRISPVASAALRHLFPVPNAGAPNAIANNFSTNFSTPITSHQGDFRVDQNISSAHTMFVRGTYKDRQVDNPPVASGTVLAGATRQPEIVYALVAAYNAVLSTSVVNELRLGFSGQRIFTTTDADARALVEAVGVQLPNPPSGNTSPTFTINGFQPTNSTASSVNRSRTIQLMDNITISRRGHTYKVGGDVRRLTAYFSNVFAAGRAGQYTFNGSISNPIVGNPYAAFLFGIPDRTQVSIVNEPDSNGVGTHYAFFAQDDWKVTPKLNINYGMRWEYHPPFTDRLDNIAVFLPDYYAVINGVGVRGAVAVPDAGQRLTNSVFAASILPTPILPASQVGLGPQLHRSQKTSFGPRIGFAWRPSSDGKTVIRGGYGRFIEAMLGTLTSAGWAVSASSVGSYTNSLVSGVPQLTMARPFPANLAQPGIQTFQLSADVNYRDPYVQQWSLTVERDIGKGIGLRASYDGNKGSNLGYTKNLAQVPANTVGFAAARSSSPFPLWNGISQETTGARSNYNAFTFAANKRMSNGLQFTTNYTFLKNLSNGQGFNPTAYATQAGGVSTDSYNIDLDYGNVAFSRRHRFLSTFLYELPFGSKGMLLKTTNKAANALIGGWQLSGVFVAQTGPFLTVIAPGADPAGNNFPNVTGNGRADIISGVSVVPENQSITNWINKAAFAIPRNNIGRPASSPVGSVVGPGTQALSLSLFKSMPITERMSFQIGAAASNALNHPNYAPPNLNYNTAPFGTITNVQVQEAGGPRSVQLTARISF
ncbi:MAG: carboxypeptidase regulatory-like domain-containing protein [Bryobacterales bacterium]|nr:carboxypeptidase regulatory-like domain-containing protein [Bryobacterales bacterium]